MPISITVAFISCDERALRLMRASPEAPCDDVSGLDLSAGHADGNAPDFLHGSTEHSDVKPVVAPIMS
jgi:hypothetical protein